MSVIGVLSVLWLCLRKHNRIGKPDDPPKGARLRFSSYTTPRDTTLEPGFSISAAYFGVSAVLLGAGSAAGLPASLVVGCGAVGNEVLGRPCGSREGEGDAPSEVAGLLALGTARDGRCVGAPLIAGVEVRAALRPAAFSTAGPASATITEFLSGTVVATVGDGVDSATRAGAVTAGRAGLSDLSRV